MDRATALSHLPHTYSLALQLRDRGLDHREIAQRLEMDKAAIGPLLELAEAKLTRLLTTSPG